MSFEHGATGAAQIAPKITACAELERERGELIRVDRSYIPEFSFWRWAKCLKMGSLRR